MGHALRSLFTANVGISRDMLFIRSVCPLHYHIVLLRMQDISEQIRHSIVSWHYGPRKVNASALGTNKHCPS